MVLENPDGKLKPGFTYEFTVRCEVVSDKEGGTIAPGMSLKTKLPAGLMPRKMPRLGKFLRRRTGLKKKTRQKWSP